MKELICPSCEYAVYFEAHEDEFICPECGDIFDQEDLDSFSTEEEKAHGDYYDEGERYYSEADYDEAASRASADMFGSR